MTTYLVTGGAGFIGSHITTRLVEEGHHVRVLDNLCTGSRDNLAHLKDGYEFWHGDVSHPIAVRRAVEGVEVIFHQAALASVPLSVKDPMAVHAACVTGTVTVLESFEFTVKRLSTAPLATATLSPPMVTL